MREIKFRAWVKGAMMLNCVGCHKGEALNDVFKDETLIFMQYTGLKDKNGEDIFEGDVLRNCEYEIVAKESRYWLTEVRWDSQYAMFTGISGETYEVIGNVYENPELLNAKI